MADLKLTTLIGGAISASFNSAMRACELLFPPDLAARVRAGEDMWASRVQPGAPPPAGMPLTGAALLAAALPRETVL